MPTFLNYVPLFLNFFVVGALFALTFYYFCIRKHFLIKLPFEKFRQSEIILTKFPISSVNNSSIKKNSNLVITYKNHELISFDKIENYSNFCYFLNHYICLNLKNKEYTDQNSLQLFLEKINVSANEAGQLFFPGYYNVEASMYNEIYCLFSEKSAQFFINYSNNRLLKFSINLFHFSVAMRDNVKFTRENLDQGLDSLDFYYNSFIRNKSDALQLWYFLINLNDAIVQGGSVKHKLNVYGESALIGDENYLKFVDYYESFIKKLTKAIKIDFKIELSTFEKVRLNIFLLKHLLYSLKKKYFIGSLYNRLPSLFKPFFSLFPLTIILFFMYNTNYHSVCSKLFVLYISIFGIKRGVDFVVQLMHYDYNDAKEKKVIAFFKTGLKYSVIFLFSLGALSFSIWFLTLDYFSFAHHNLIYLCFYLTYIIIYIITYIIKYIISKINRKAILRD